MRKFGLIGYPLEHSFSKSYFKGKFEKENIGDAVYENYPISDPSEFDALYRNDPELCGLNVTIPYKESIIKYLDVLSEDARNIGAVNTICLCRKTGKLVKVGHNTDFIGFRKSLEERLVEKPEKALVLGTGGSSRAVSYVLQKMGAEVIKVSSSGKQDSISYQEVTRELVRSAKLIVNTTPLGMHPDTAAYPDIPYDAITGKHLLFDLVYNPELTQFLRVGKEKGAATVNGYDMLVYQAEGSWEIWNRK
ncbi:MAG: shikimate dehydrogenase [Bacteroidales bacterium]|nr:shikimate dehydrogenase [Bacteroidales bacterium]